MFPAYFIYSSFFFFSFILSLGRVVVGGGSNSFGSIEKRFNTDDHTRTLRKTLQ